MHRRRLLLRFVVGLFNRAAWKQHCGSRFVRLESVARLAVEEETRFDQCDVGNLGKSRRTRRVENNFFESIAPVVSNKLAELLLWADEDPVQRLHVLDQRWPNSRSLSLYLLGNFRAAWAECGSGQNASATGRILDLGRSVRGHDFSVCYSDANRLEDDS